jgi:3D (Asp-Asp-Asp) domain-containing protein
LLCFTGSLATPESSQQRATAPQVTVLVDGRSSELQTSAATVAELLERLEVTLSPLDRTDPSPNTRLADRMTVQVTRVACREEVVEEAVSPRTIVLGDPDRPAEATEVLRRGTEGLVRKTVRVWTKDGEETHHSVVGEEPIRERTDTIVLRGTHGLATRGDWRQPIMMEATAYEPGPRSCGRWADGRTAIGLKAEKGVVAVDDRVIPMRTRLYIPGYGFAIAADRGSAIKGKRIDLCYATYEEAIRFGRQPVKVYILD